MATVHSTKIGSGGSVAPGAVSQFKWNNPPWGTVLGYFACPTPPNPSGPHGTSRGEVAVTRVRCHWTRDNYNSDSKYVLIDVTNTGDQPTSYDLYQSWIG